MAYLVLARKWRPKGFDAITGQDHVTRTLRNAIAQDRVHHAFLFCGARGVGKTSAARVFARALNCLNADGPTAEPCGVCSACTEIAAGTSVDVFEIDGASNRGISEIRELRDGVAYAPQRDRYKIYIIDEVHMLTTEAFNALLKTLEEPPSHVKFIFATTEPHKIPVTILSRCQRFDFKRIPMPIMVQRLTEILEAEGVHIAEAGLRLVARESEGSMRDALSLLDRVISACGQEATFEVVAEVLGVADRAWLNGLVEAAIARDPKQGLTLASAIFEYGVDLRKFVSDLVHHLRDLAMLQLAGDDAPTELSTDERAAMSALATRMGPEDIQRLIRMTIETAERLVQASFPRLELEMLIIRMCRLQPVQPLDILLARLAALERRLTSGEPLPPRRAPAGDLPKAEAQAKDLGPQASPAPTSLKAETPAPVAIVPAPSPLPSAFTPAAGSAPAAPVDKGAAASAAAPVDEGASASAAAPLDEGAAASAAAPLDEGSSPPPEAPLPEPGEGALDDGAWERLVEGLRDAQPALAGALDHLAVQTLCNGHLTLYVAGEVTEKRVAARLEEVIALLSEQDPRIATVELLRVESLTGSPHQRRAAREGQRREALRADVAGHPLVMKLQERFGGSLGEVELTVKTDGRMR